MSIGSYWDIPLCRQKEITKIANRKRRLFTEWQRRQISIWRKALDSNKELPEQQRFFMRDIECALIYRKLLQPEKAG